MGINARGLYSTATDAEDPFYVKGNWYTIYDQVNGQPGAVLGVNTLRLVPFRIRAMVDIVTLGARITTLSAAGFFQLAIYRANANTLLPTGRPVANTGNIATDATGNFSGVLTQGRVRLDRGVYWYGVIADNNTVVFQAALYGPSAHSALIGASTQDLIVPGNASSNMNRFLVNPLTFGNWPDLTDPTATALANGFNWVLGQFQVAP